MGCMGRDQYHEAALERAKNRKKNAEEMMKWLVSETKEEQLLNASGNKQLEHNLMLMRQPSGNSVTFAQIAQVEADIAESKLCHAISIFGKQKFEELINSYPITNKMARKIAEWWDKHKTMDSKRITYENELKREPLIEQADEKIRKMTNKQLKEFLKQ